MPSGLFNYEETIQPMGLSPVWDPSTINMYLGDDPAPRPPSSQPTEQQLQKEYQDYMNSIGNPPTVTNHYFYWRADRLSGTAGDSPQFVPPSQTFPPQSSGNAHEELAKLTPDVRGRTAFSVGSMMQDQLSAMAHKLTGIPHSIGGRLSPENEQLLAQAQETLMAMVQAKMDQGIPFEEAFANVYNEQGAPKTIKRTPEGKPEDGEPDRCRNGVCGDPPYCPVKW